MQNVYDPQLLNRYAFERNNPYKYTDDDGHSVVLAIIGYIVARGGIGAYSAGVSDYLAQSRKGPVNWWRVAKQSLKGFGKGAVIGGVEVAIVGAGIASGNYAGAILGVGTAAFVGENVIENLWDISYKEDEENPEKKIAKVENLPGYRNPYEIMQQETNLQSRSGRTVVEYNSGKGSSSRGGYVFKGEDKSALQSLAKMSRNANKGETAGDIIKKWRKKYKK